MINSHSAMRVQQAETPGNWTVHMAYELSDGQRIELALVVTLAHPSPRVSDLERLCLEQAQLLLANMLKHMPDRQDK